jgi:predicted peptidase
MNHRLFLVPLALLAAACSGGGDGPTQSIGGTNNPPLGGNPAISGDTNVATLGFVTKTVTVGGVSYGYQVFVPANYNAQKKVPVIVYMHGAGESGSDNDRQTRIGLGELVRAQMSTFPALVVFPQSTFGEGKWPIYTQIVPAAIDQVIAHYGRADTTRLYMTGWSYGGVHGFDVAYQTPTRFAAFVPMGALICGSCITGTSGTSVVQGAQLVSQKLKDLPIWQFHGSQDKTVLPSFIKPQVDLLIASDANYQYTEFPNVDHQITAAVYGYAPMWTWLWAQHR